MMMQEVANIKAAVNPQEILFVVDSMTGQDAVNTAKAFNDRLDFTGVVLTKLDGDTRGGASALDHSGQRVDEPAQVLQLLRISGICPSSCAIDSNCAARTASIGPPCGLMAPVSSASDCAQPSRNPGWRRALRRRSRLGFRLRRLAGGAPATRVCGSALRGRLLACCHRHTRLNAVVDPGIARRPR